jgi:hypothetical protein
MSTEKLSKDKTRTMIFPVFRFSMGHVAQGKKRKIEDTEREEVQLQQNQGDLEERVGLAGEDGNHTPNGILQLSSHLEQCAPAREKRPCVSVCNGSFGVGGRRVAARRHNADERGEHAPQNQVSEDKTMGAGVGCGSNLWSPVRTFAALAAATTAAAESSASSLAAALTLPSTGLSSPSATVEAGSAVKISESSAPHSSDNSKMGASPHKPLAPIFVVRKTPASPQELGAFGVPADTPDEYDSSWLQRKVLTKPALVSPSSSNLATLRSRLENLLQYSFRRRRFPMRSVW